MLFSCSDELMDSSSSEPGGASLTAPKAIAPPSHSSSLPDFSLPGHSSQPPAPQRMPCLNKKGRSRANICVFRTHLALTGTGFPSGAEHKPLPGRFCSAWPKQEEGAQAGI